MSDEKDVNLDDLGPGATKQDLKSAADELLKQAKAADKAAQAAEGDVESLLQDDDAALDLEHLSEIPSEDGAPTTDQIIAALELEKSEMKDQLLRTMAEMQNVRKRAEKQVADARTFAIEKFAGDLLSVSDNLSRALQALSDKDRAGLSESGKNLLGGIDMTQKELHTVMARHGVTAIAAEPGDAFDPNVHQAVANIPSDQPNGMIAELFQPGWKIGERTLRAAMVAVSAGAAN